MVWVVIASILFFQISATLVVLQLLVNSFWYWARWMIWIVALAASLAMLAWTLSVVDKTIASNHYMWSPRFDKFSLNAPLRTYRLLLMSSASALPVLLAALACASLLRARHGA